MNYAEQHTYLMRGRMAAALLIAIWLSLAAMAALSAGASIRSRVAFSLIVAAIAASLAYSPDYLHLTVNRKKRIRWAVKIRWRIAAVALLAGLACATSLRGIVIVVIAATWVLAANRLASKIPSRYFFAYFWITDLLLLAVLLLGNLSGPLVGAGLLAGSAHLCIVISEKRPVVPLAVVLGSGGGLLWAAASALPMNPNFFRGAAGLLAVASSATAVLVYRAQRRNSRNVEVALRELMDFTGYEQGKIQQLWSESDQMLARNWVGAALDESNAEALAEWYRQNSELYMFAISGYNLDYKRICSNLKVLRFGRGDCLDYGAGNGEVILELARRGHPATYYDVDGVSAKFARHRCQKRGLRVNFVHTKEALANAARQQRFDTVFSLDVLEHLPDLAGQLIFLASLLNPGGLMLFDVPAGTTKSHPMHLNHTVEVKGVLTARGLIEKRALWQKLPFIKQEKYLFVAG